MHHASTSSPGLIEVFVVDSPTVSSKEIDFTRKILLSPFKLIQATDSTFCESSKITLGRKDVKTMDLIKNTSPQML